MISDLGEVVRRMEDLAFNGYGVAWHPVHKKYWPFEADGEVIDWWHDADGCAHTSFVKSILLTHDQMLTMVEVNEEGTSSARFMTAVLKRLGA
jgi:hypothetical protein